MQQLKKTALYSEHIKLNAKMGPFAGFDMPIQYISLKDEVLAVRNNVGVFDVGHMGEFLATGPQCTEFIDYLVTNEIKSAPIKKAIYSPLCNEEGRVIDDLIVYKLDKQKILICVNASNIEKDWNWFNKHTKDFDVNLQNISEETSLLAIQGPNAEKQLRNLGLFPDTVLNLGYYEVEEISSMKEFIVVARTGYTGEDGFEIFCSHQQAQLLWTKLIEQGVVPCGLGARDVLRLEVCFPLYGHEMDENLTPLDAGLKWAIKSKKEKFIGKEVFENLIPKYNLLKLSLETGIPRQGYNVVNDKGEKIGQITSGTLSVGLNKGIALAHILHDRLKELKEPRSIFVEIRNKVHQAIIQKKSFIIGGHK